MEITFAYNEITISSHKSELDMRNTEIKLTKNNLQQRGYTHQVKYNEAQNSKAYMVIKAK